MIAQADLQGHWRRDWIRAPGFEDGSTRVHWMQAGTLFADLRIPMERPIADGREALCEFSQPELEQLLGAEGFAGEISLKENRCTWHRELNWHGVPENEDTGRMTFEDGALMEDGVHADYRERWLPEPIGTLRGYRISAGPESGIMIENDQIFLFGIGARPKGNSKGLINALTAGTAEKTQLQQHFESQFCFGIWDGDEGIATLSTNPFCEGQPVVKKGKKVEITLTDYEGFLRTRVFTGP